MAKYNTGDKFVVEIEKFIGAEGDHEWYNVVGIDEWQFSDKDFDALTLYKEKNISAQQQTDKYNEGYENGIKAAWEFAQYICKPEEDGGMTNQMSADLFGVEELHETISNHTYKEIKAMVAKYRFSFKIGDEVEHVKTKAKFIVIGVEGMNLYVANEYGTRCISKEDLRKTGEHNNEVYNVLCSAVKHIGEDRYKKDFDYIEY